MIDKVIISEVHHDQDDDDIFLDGDEVNEKDDKQDDN